jgi:hypothetical protein
MGVRSLKDDHRISLKTRTNIHYLQESKQQYASKVKVKLSRYMPWRRMGGEEV